ncbi:MAG: hypothetical protein ACRETG_06520 [Steroidobacteraceae bacterium]
MNEQDLARFEAQAAETVGAMKELFAEFERRLGEVVAAQRLASSEARNEGVKARAALEELARQARAIAEAQRQAIAELRGGWQLHVAENSKAAGQELARAFGEQIASGLQQRLERLGDAVERVTRRFEWATALKWGGAMAIGCVLLVLIGVWALLPSVDGLSSSQVRAAVTRLAPCHIGHERHVCIAADAGTRVGKAVDGADLVIISGL